MIDVERLRRKVEQYSAICGRPPKDEMQTTVVLVPPGSPLAPGFERAHGEIEAGRAVRLVGMAATLPEGWPSWTRRAEGMMVTELGAYQTRTRIETSAPLRRAVVEWCDAIFAGVVENVAGSEVFYSATTLRLAQDVMDTTALVEGIGALHHNDPLVWTDSTWPGVPLLRALRGEQPAKHGRGFGPGVMAGTALGWAAAAASKVKERVRAGPAVRRLGELRAAETDDPNLWLAVIADWPRFNGYLLGALAEPLRREKIPFGLLLLQSLGVGTRSEEDMSIEGQELWRGLGSLREELDGRPVELAAMPVAPGAFLRALVGAAPASMIAAWRVARRGPWLGSTPESKVWIGGKKRALAKLLSMDVLRARLAAAAMTDVIRRRPFSGLPVVFSAANLEALATPERMLNRAGARTAEFTHGIGVDAWHGTAETRAAVRFAWTHTDAEALGPLGRPIRVAGLPVPPNRPRRPKARRILILTNYFHRDLIAGRSDRAPFQGELLGLVARLRHAGPKLGLEFRWRPHPAEIEALVQESYGKLENVELSRDCPLADDLSWADLVVSAYSSTVIEAMFAGLPAFVHLRPELEDTPFCGFIAEERRYFYAKDVVDRILHCLNRLDAGDDSVLEPEARGRERAVGPSGSPIPLHSAVREWIAEQTPELGS